jgi:hypothetical protein
MPLLLLKITLTPLLIGGASLAARRWGPSIGGWIVSLPLTSGPILFFLALDHGTPFAAAAVVGTLLGLGAIAAFSVAYAALSSRGPWAAIAAASIAYAVAGLAVQPIAGAPFVALVVLVAGAIALVLRWLPAGFAARSSDPHPAWDLPARMIVGTGLVVGLTTIAPLLGPVTSGLIATFPVYVSVLSVFTQLREGRWGAIGVLRGLLVGLFGTVAFYVVVRALVDPAGVAAAFIAAIAVTLAIQSVALRAVRAGAAEAT